MDNNELDNYLDSLITEEKKKIKIKGIDEEFISFTDLYDYIKKNVKKKGDYFIFELKIENTNMEFQMLDIRNITIYLFKFYKKN